MADRINLIEDDDTEDTSFRFTPKRVVSAGEYGSSFINFYNTTLVSVATILGILELGLDVSRKTGHLLFRIEQTYGSVIRRLEKIIF